MRGGIWNSKVYSNNCSDVIIFLLGLVVFLLGIIMRLVAVGKHGIIPQLTSDFGTFISASVAIPFIYRYFISKEDREIFINDLKETMENALDKRVSIKVYPRRPTIQEEANIVSNASREVIHVGTTLSNLAHNLCDRPSYEFKDRIEYLLRIGVTYKCFAIEPNCPIAKVYSEDQNEPDFNDTIATSLDKVRNIRCEFEKKHLTGRFEIYTYRKFPYFRGIFVDGENIEGSMKLTPSLFGVKRPETPTFVFCRKDYPGLYEKYWESLKVVISDAHLVE